MIIFVELALFILLIVTKLLKLFDMTKPPLGKVEALLYVLQHVITRGHARILTHPLLMIFTHFYSGGKNVTKK